MQFTKIISKALAEDIGKMDLTTSAIITSDKTSKAEIMAKEDCIIAGLDIAECVLKKLDRKSNFLPKVKDGEFVKKNTIIATIKAKISSILTAERVMLNFLQRLSGIATLTSKYVRLAYPVKIMDTRKTAPNLRILERYAVRVGGGFNHRFNLNSAILIKDNHIKVSGGVREAIKRVREKFPKLKIEIEADNLKQVKEIISLNNVDTIMLDNMGLEDMKKAVKIIDKKSKVEVSGNVNLDNVKKIAKLDVDFISVGALTHSAKSSDLSLKIK